MRGPRRGGSGRGLRAPARVTAAMVSAGFCLLAAPAAHADFEDLIDTLIGAASAGPIDVADIPSGSMDLDAAGVLQDPLAQLDQVLHGSPDQPSPEPATAGASTETNPDAPSDTNSGTTGDATPTPAGSGHQGGNSGGSGNSGSSANSGSSGSSGSSGNSNNSTSFPKFSMPSGGSGGSGGSGNGGGSGGSGSGSGAPGGNNKSKPNTRADKPGADLPKAEGDGGS